MTTCLMLCNMSRAVLRYGMCAEKHRQYIGILSHCGGLDRVVLFLC